MTDESLAQRSDADASTPQPPSTTDAASVAAWLEAHPDFFAGREALLAEMSLPHQAGQAVSLVERQLGVLRERNAELHRRLSDMMATARANHGIFERTLTITTALMDTQTAADAVRRLSESLKNGFEIDASAVCIVDESGVDPTLAGDAVTGEDARGAIGNLLRPGRIVCGMLRDPELTFLFGTRATEVASAVVMPVEIPGGIVVIALGSRDADHFSPEMGTLFIRFLGETLGQRVAQLVVQT